MSKYVVVLAGHPFLLKAKMDTEGQTLLIEANGIETAKALEAEFSQTKHAIHIVRKATKKDEREHSEALRFPDEAIAIKSKIIEAYASFSKTTAYTITGVILDESGNHQAGFTFGHEDSGVTLERLAQWVASLRGYEPEHYKTVVEVDGDHASLEATYKDSTVLNYTVMPVPPMKVTFEMMRESFFGQLTDGLENRTSTARKSAQD